MNIDERLEKLTERTDAIAQSMELLVSMHKDNEKRMEQFTQEMKGFGKRHAQLESLVMEIAEGTARLLHAVEAHEHRITDLEGNQTQQ